ncbi:MAG: hypothetical protein IKK83_01310 [Clostridia bacterium]|nr:hypothetical protein [Clostridia bacterium]
MGLISKLKSVFFRSGIKGIKSFEQVLLRESTMRTTTEYEINGGDGATLSLYRIRYTGVEERVLEKSVRCDGESIAALLNSCGVHRWDGFHGKHPRHVSDGTVFRFHATVNGGVDIRADGSARFPKGYRELVRYLDSLLAKTE